LISLVIIAGAQEALSAPTTKQQHGTSGLVVPATVESAPQWSSQEKLGGAFNGLKSGVDEDSLLALLLEDSPNANESLLSHGFESASPLPPRLQQGNKPSAYASSVSSAVFAYCNLFPLTLLLVYTIALTPLYCLFSVSRFRPSHVVSSFSVSNRPNLLQVV
jgi:hypothetical protein